MPSIRDEAVVPGRRDDRAKVGTCWALPCCGVIRNTQDEIHAELLDDRRALLGALPHLADCVQPKGQSPPRPVSLVSASNAFSSMVWRPGRS